jgi:hypothetical protein
MNFDSRKRELCLVKGDGFGFLEEVIMPGNG